MPWVGFEPTIPASERAKTVHVLDFSATVTGQIVGYLIKIILELDYGYRQILLAYNSVFGK
jgi:hypothetical protein